MFFLRIELIQYLASLVSFNYLTALLSNRIHCCELTLELTGLILSMLFSPLFIYKKRKLFHRLINSNELTAMVLFARKPLR